MIKNKFTIIPDPALLAIMSTAVSNQALVAEYKKRRANSTQRRDRDEIIEIIRQ